MPTRANRARTILYIEDNPSNVKLVEAALKLRRSRVRLLTATAGKRGVELAEKVKPNLVLLDMHLPDVSGVDVLKLLKAHRSTHDIPVIVLSADVGQALIKQVLAAGAIAYLTKPIHLDEFLAAIDQGLRAQA